MEGVTKIFYLSAEDSKIQEEIYKEIEKLVNRPPVDGLEIYTNNIINKKLHTIPGVRKTRTYVLTHILKQSSNWPFPEKLPDF